MRETIHVGRRTSVAARCQCGYKRALVVLERGGGRHVHSVQTVCFCFYLFYRGPSWRAGTLVVTVYSATDKGGDDVHLYYDGKGHYSLVRKSWLERHLGQRLPSRATSRRGSTSAPILLSSVVRSSVPCRRRTASKGAHHG